MSRYWAALVLAATLAGADDKVELTGLKIVGGEKKFVEATGAVALTNGILEFVSVMPGGREYESLLTITAKPSALQFALLLIGAEPGKVPEAGMPKTHLPDFERGSRLVIEVEWTADGETRRVPVSAWLRDRKTGQAPAKLEWIFSGSYFTEDFNGHQLFIADAEEAHVGLWWNPAIPVNVMGEHGNPYQGDQAGFEANTAVVPPVGTPVKVIFHQP